MRRLAWLLAGAAFASRALDAAGEDVAADDVAFLQQSVQAQHVDRRTGVLEERGSEQAADGLLRADALPNNPASKQTKEQAKGGIYVNRQIRTRAEGSKVAFYLWPGCKVHDEHGNTNCTLHWDEDAELRWGIVVPSGLRAGDVVNLSASLNFDAANAGGALSDVAKALSLTANSTIGMNMTCSLCTGSCAHRMAFEAANLLWDGSYPTIANEETMCKQVLKGEKVTDFDLANVNFKLPSGPFEALNLRGGLNFELSLSRPGVGELLAQNASLQLLPRPQQPPGRRKAAAARLVALPGPGPSLEGSTEAEEAAEPAREWSVFGALAKLQGRSWAESAEEVVKLWQERSHVSGKKLQNVVVRLREAKFAGSEDYRANASLAGEGCKSPEGGDSECIFPFKSKSNVTLKWRSDYVLEPGSYMHVKMGPTLQGPFGKLITNKFGVDVNMPACGDEKVKVRIMMQKMEVWPPKCGRYAHNFSISDFEVAVPDIANMKSKEFIPKDVELPITLPDTVVNLPPLGMHTGVQIYKKDGSPIMSFIYEVGLDH